MRLLLAAAALSLLAGEAAGQGVVTVRARECATCVLVLERRVTLRLPDSLSFTSLYVAPAIDRQGRYWVPTAEGRLAVFSPTGRLTAVVGRKGGGPGEMLSIERLLVGDGDTVYAFDRAARRLTAFSVANLAAVRSQPTPRFVDAFLRPDGTLVFSYAVYSASSAGYPMHVATPQGNIVRSLGTPEADAEVGDNTPMYRAIARSADGLVWLGHWNQYLIEQVDANMMRRAAYRRSVPWFPKSAGPPVRNPLTDRPRPTLRQLRATQAGIFTNVQVAREGWKPTALPKPSGPSIPESGSRPITSQETATRFLDTIIELIELPQATVIATLRVPGALLFVEGSDELVFQRRETPEGDWVLDVMRLVIHR